MHVRFIGTMLFAAAMGFAAIGAAQAQAPAAAPDQQEMMKLMHRGARNQLGVLEYCQGKGAFGPEVVAVQRKMIGMLPPMEVDKLDEAEATGKSGVVSMGPTTMSLADAAKAQGRTELAMCKQMGELISAQAAKLPQ